MNQDWTYDNILRNRHTKNMKTASEIMQETFETHWRAFQKARKRHDNTNQQKQKAWVQNENDS